MAFNWNDYNEHRDEIQAQGEFTVLPDGYYNVIIDQVEWKSTVRGDGSYMEVAMSVIDPEQYSGTPVVDRLNLDNPSEKAVRVALGTLKRIEIASGREFGSDDDMVGVLIQVKTEREAYKKQDGSEGLSHRVKGYYASGKHAVGAFNEQPAPQVPRSNSNTTALEATPSAAQPQPRREPVNAGSESAKPWKR